MKPVYSPKGISSQDGEAQKLRGSYSHSPGPMNVGKKATAEMDIFMGTKSGASSLGKNSRRTSK